MAYRFEEGDSGEGVPIGLLKARAAVVLNTSNTPQARELEAFGDPLDTLWRRCIFDLCGVRTFHRRMFGVIVTGTAEQRRAWIEEARALCRDVFPAINAEDEAREKDLTGGDGKPIYYLIDRKNRKTQGRLMKLSTRARYGVRLMLDLALKYGKGPVYLKDIAKEEEISEKYLSVIIIPLKAAGLVNATRGAHGGYALAKQPAAISLKEVVDILEGGTCLVDCVKDPSACARSQTCASRDVWNLLSARMSETLSAMNLETLATMSREKANPDSPMYHI